MRTREKWERASVTQRKRQMEVERQWVRQIEVHHPRLSLLSLFGTLLLWHTNQMVGMSDSYLQGWCSVFRWKERLHLSRQSSAHGAQARAVTLIHKGGAPLLSRHLASLGPLWHFWLTRWSPKQMQDNWFLFDSHFCNSHAHGCTSLI